METTIDPAVDAPPAELPPLIDGDLNFSEGWQERVGEHAEGATFKNLSDVLKSNKESQRAISEHGNVKAELTRQLAEAQAATPAAPEMPADADAFKAQLKLPDMPEGITLGDDILDKAIAYAMEKGHGPEALTDFLSFDLQRVALETEAQKTAAFEQQGMSRDTITAAVGEQNYDVTIADARFALETLGLPLDANDMVNQPNMVLALSKLKNSLSEGTLKGASIGGVDITNGSSLARAEDIISNPSNPLHEAFYDNSHTQYAQAQAEHARLISESAQ